MVLPHRIIFVLGLDAQAYPGSTQKTPSDLLTHKRIVGDSDAVRDNRFAFLELVHAARERLVLSFRARNLQKEEELQPSSVLLELEAYLKSQQVSVRREIPWILRENLASLQDQNRPQGTWNEDELRLAALRTLPRARLRYDNRCSNATYLLNTNRINFLHLQTFLSNPLEYHISKTLGLELEDELETLQATDEPLTTDARTLSMLQGNVWSGLLQAVFPLHAEEELKSASLLEDLVRKQVQQLHNAHLLQGSSPEAQFADIEYHNLLSWGFRLISRALDLRQTFPDHQLVQRVDLSLGRAGFSATLEVCFDDSTCHLIECRHAMALVPRHWGPYAYVALLHASNRDEASKDFTLWLSGVLQALAAPDDLQLSLVHLNRKECKTTQYELANWTSARPKIQAWLNQRVQDMVVRGVTDHLPMATLFQIVHSKKNEDVNWDLLSREALEKELGKEFGSYHNYMPAFALVDARIPDISDDELRQRAQERYAPWIEGWLINDL